MEVFYIKGVLKILQNSQENTCVRICNRATLFKKGLRHFPVNFANFSRNSFHITPAMAAFHITPPMAACVSNSFENKLQVEAFKVRINC